MKNKIEHILLIDDNEIDNFINRKIISQKNICSKIHVFNSSIDALDYFKKTATINLLALDVILLDLNMPGYNGFELLALIEDKLLSKNPKIKTIFLTTSINPCDKIEANKFKTCCGFMNKPLEIERLLKLIFP